MKAMILAAGKGKRMRPLTDTTPKPLLTINNKPLIQYHIENLVKAGITEIIINVAYLGEQIIQYLGDGSQFNCQIQFSTEEIDAFETAGGIKHALRYIGKDDFIVVNGDVWTDYNFKKLKPLRAGQLAHLILVPNPDHHPQGDFSLSDDVISLEQHEKWTYSGIGCYSPKLFEHITEFPAPLGPILKQACKHQLLTGELFLGEWCDIGTPERLRAVQINTIKG